MLNVTVAEGNELTLLVIVWGVLIGKAFVTRCALFRGTQIERAEAVVVEGVEMNFAVNFVAIGLGRVECRTEEVEEEEEEEEEEVEEEEEEEDDKEDVICFMRELCVEFKFIFLVKSADERARTVDCCATVCAARAATARVSPIIARMYALSCAYP